MPILEKPFFCDSGVWRCAIEKAIVLEQTRLILDNREDRDGRNGFLRVFFSGCEEDINTGALMHGTTPPLRVCQKTCCRRKCGEVEKDFLPYRHSKVENDFRYLPLSSRRGREAKEEECAVKTGGGRRAQSSSKRSND